MSGIELAKKKTSISIFFEERKGQISAALPNVGITTDRMVRLVFSAMNQNPNLLQCSQQSLFNAMIQCSSLGLEPNTRLGQAYLVPFGKEVQLIIGYPGYISLARRAGDLSSLNAHVVREGDVFEYYLGTEEKIKHVPNYDNFETRKNKIQFAYAVARFKDGSISFEVMSIHEVEDIRKRSKTPTKGPWVTDYEMMCRKTVIRRLMHYIPLSTTRLAEAAAIDGQNEDGIQDMAGIIDIDVNETENRQKDGSLEQMAAMDGGDPFKTGTDDKMVSNLRNMIFAKLGKMYGGDEAEINKCLASIEDPSLSAVPNIENLGSFNQSELKTILNYTKQAFDMWEEDQKVGEKGNK